MSRRAVGVAAAVALLTSVLIANWATSRFGFVAVGFGQAATAGSYAAGIALAARDALQAALGRRWMLTTLAAAGALSFVVAAGELAAPTPVCGGDRMRFGRRNVLDVRAGRELRATDALDQPHGYGAGDVRDGRVVMKPKPAAADYLREAEECRRGGRLDLAAQWAVLAIAAALVDLADDGRDRS